MNDSATESQPSNWLGKLGRLFSSSPATRDDIGNILRAAHADKVIDEEALEIMEGALTVSGQQVREIMVPRSRMVVIPEDASLESVLNLVIKSNHSRFPVTGESMDEIKGILLAKELLPLVLGGVDGFSIAQIVRPATIIPESKRLNVLLKEFREQRYHMAVVMDEYASVAGLVTIEDVLEEIVGDIEDETDRESNHGISTLSDGSYEVPALTTVEDCNEFFDSGFNEDEFDTIGGLVVQSFGHVPKVGETTHIENYQFTVTSSDDRQIHQLAVRPLTEAEEL